MSAEHQAHAKTSPLRVGVIFSLMSISGGGSEPVEYRGIRMRSHLEANYAKHLDRLGVKWQYEPRPFFANNRGYLPDFQVELGPRPCFVEVKPTIGQGQAAKKRMEVIWNEIPDAFLVVVCAEKSTYFGANKGGEWTRWAERWASR